MFDVIQVVLVSNAMLSAMARQIQQVYSICNIHYAMLQECLLLVACFICSFEHLNRHMTYRGIILCCLSLLVSF